MLRIMFSKYLSFVFVFCRFLFKIKKKTYIQLRLTLTGFYTEVNYLILWNKCLNFIIFFYSFGAVSVHEYDMEYELNDLKPVAGRPKTPMVSFPHNLSTYNL